jgi:hypothetical protein
MAILLCFKLLVLFVMTLVLFWSMNRREKILGLNEEIVRRNEKLESPPYSSYNNTKEHNYVNREI